MTERILLDDVPAIPDMSIVSLDDHRDDPDSWEPINLGNLDERPPIKPTLGTAGIAYPGKRHVFSGPQESAKTLAAYAIGLEVVRDGKPIVIIDFEMGQWDARDRLQELGCTQQEFAHIRYVEPHEPATHDRIERLVIAQPHLVIIDAAAGAYDLQGLDDNKRQDVERFTRIYVRDFWRASIATIVLDHVVKNTDNRGKYAIGSERKVGGADVHLGFEVVVPIKRGTTGIYKISTHKDRGGFLQRGRLADMHLTSHPETHAITWEFKEADHTDGDEPWRPTKMMERVSEYLQTQPEPVSFQHVLTNTKGRDSVLKDALEHLIALGYVTESQGERSARMVANLTLYKHEEHPKTQPLPTSAPPLPADVPATSATSAPPSRGQSVQEEPEADPTSAAYQLDEDDQRFLEQLNHHASDLNPQTPSPPDDPLPL